MILVHGRQVSEILARGSGTGGGSSGNRNLRGVLSFLCLRTMIEVVNGLSGKLLCLYLLDSINTLYTMLYKTQQLANR